jgi:LDH2 family malate/lactate/ureidoglycolate dehydrogenase
MKKPAHKALHKKPNLLVQLTERREAAEAVEVRGPGRPPTTKEHRTPMGIQITVSLRQRIENAATMRGVPLSLIITEALNKYVP